MPPTQLPDKAFFGLISSILTVIAFYPFLLGVIKETVKPHMFSWIIWALSTGVVFVAQLQAQGGAGAWPTGVSGVITIIVAIIAITKRSDIKITLSDKIYFGLALASLPMWYFTSDPTGSVIILTVVDLLGFGPTVRNVKDDPNSESGLFYFLFGVRSLISLFALGSLSIATFLFPLVIGLACFGIVLWIGFVRRRHGLGMVSGKAVGEITTKKIKKGT